MTDFIDPNSISPAPSSGAQETSSVPPPTPGSAGEVTFPAHFAWPEPSSEEHESSSEDSLFDEDRTTLPLHHASREPQWKTALRRELNAWVDELPDTAEAPDVPHLPHDQDDAPDLYHFYEQLTAANADAKKANRRNAEAFALWSKQLEQMSGEIRVLRERIPAPDPSNKEKMSRKQSLGIVELHDRLQRLAGTFGKTPPTSFFGGTSAWLQAWQTQEKGVRILLEHFEGYLRQYGITQISVKGKPFDPTTMNAIAAEPSKSVAPQTVLEELAPAYQINGELLRPAQVKVATS